MTPDGITRLKRDEARGGVAALFVYDDKTGKNVRPGDTAGSTVGYATIGFGRNLCTRGITPTEALMLMSNDIALVELTMATCYPATVPLIDTPRGDVLVNISINTGTLAKWPKLMAAVGAGMWIASAGQIANSQSYNDPLLHDRYERLRMAMLANSWADLLV